jgi:hypothetical protein
MIRGFYDDLARAQSAEHLVIDVLSALNTDYTFLAVGMDREYFHKGDIKVVANNGKENFIEVKNDSVIYKTGNILLEDEVYYKDNDWYGKGNLHSDYEYYAIVSEQERRIYILDFSILREASRLGEYKVIEHPSQVTYCYLLPLGVAKAKGAVITTLNY